MKDSFDELIRTGSDADALRHVANEYYKNGKMGHTRKLLLERAADRIDQLEQTWEWSMYKSAKREIDRLRKEYVYLAIESIERDKALAKLEAEATAVIDRQGKWIKTTLDSGWVECVCSICGGDAPAEYGRYTWIKTDFCPHCGARMEDMK